MTSAQNFLTHILACIATSFILFVQPAHGQTNTRNNTWGEWYQLNDNCLPQPCGAAVAFLSDACKNGSPYHNGLTWKFRNDRIVKDAYIKFKFDHRKCDGSVATDEVTLYLDRTGEWKSSGDLETGNSYELATAPYDIRYIDPNKDKVASLRKEGSSTIMDVGNTFTLMESDVKQIGNNYPDLSNQYHSMKQEYYSKKSSFEKAERSNDYDALQNALNDIKVLKSDAASLYHQIHNNATDRKPTKSNTAVIGDRADNTTANPQVQSAAITNANSSNAQQQAQLRQRQQQLEKQRQEAARKQAEQQEIRQKIVQGQQEMQQQTNQTIQNSIQQGTDALTNYADFLASESAKKEEARQQQQAIQQAAAEERRQREAAEQQQAEYERQQQEIAAEQERIRREQERLRQQSITEQMLGNISAFKKTSDLSDNITKAYFITFQRDYTKNKVTLKRYQLNKYSDGTWMMQSDMLNKINFQIYANDYGESKLLGAYANMQELNAAFRHFFDLNANSGSSQLSSDDSILEINNNKAAGTDKDFWNN